MKGVILDADSLGKGDIDLAPITSTLDTWDIHPFTTASQIMDRIRDADFVLTNKIPLREPQLSNAPKLKLISVMATGTNNVDLAEARQRNIAVSNAVAYATPSVVQHTISLMLMLATNVIRYVGDVRAGAWQKSPVFCLLDHPIVEMSGKVLGIVGHGELGSNVARVAEALGLQVLISARPGAGPTAGRVPFEDVLRRSDFVSLHCPLTADNENMINSATLALMKPTAFLVNTARGGLVHSEDLITALQRGVIAGAAIDVLTTEPPRTDQPLLAPGLNNLIVTPHNAWGARESRQRLVRQMRENIDAFQAGTPIRLVN